MAFAELEPFGSLVDDIRAGLGPAVAVNMKRPPPEEGKPQPPPVTALSWYPWHEPPKAAPEPDPDSPEVLSARIKAMLTRAGKAAKKGNNV